MLLKQDKAKKRKKEMQRKACQFHKTFKSNKSFIAVYAVA